MEARRHEGVMELRYTASLAVVQHNYWWHLRTSYAISLLNKYLFNF